MRQSTVGTGILASGLFLLMICSGAQAQQVERVPLPKDHPLVGTWRVEIPNTRCHETYDVRTDGSIHVTSAAQTAESDLALSLQPAPTGFYKWTEKVSMQNGQPDCQGQKVAVGQVSTNFIILDAPAKEFLMCAAEDINTCVGPFVRQGGT
jgi:hypothetical protein